MIRIAIVDDHPIVRLGLKHVLSDHADLAVTGEASNAAEAGELLRRRTFDVLLLDLSLPGRGGLDVLQELQHRRIRTPVLILSMHAESAYAIRALKAGAAGYLCKDSAPEALVKAIRKVHRGGRYVSDTLAERLAEELHTPSSASPHEKLTAREYQVMIMLAGGKRVADIGAALHLSAKTVSTYRTRLLAKLGLACNAELTRYAIERGLLG